MACPRIFAHREPSPPADQASNDRTAGARSPHRLVGALVAAVLALAAGPAAAAGYEVVRTFEGGDYAFGSALAANARHLVVGSASESIDENIASGAVYVYDRETGALRTRLTTAEAIRYFRFFGSALALEDDLLAVHERGGGIEVDHQHSGAVHLYDAATGALLRTLVHPDPTHRFGFGTALALVDGQLFASAPFMDYHFGSPGGQLYVFDAATGALLRTIDDPTPTSGSAFGIAFVVTADEILVQDYNAWDDTTVLRFERATGALLGELRPADPRLRGFGAPLAVHDGRLVAAGRLDDGPLTNGEPGAVFVFDLATGTLERTLTGPRPDVDGFTPALAFGPAGILAAQPIWTRRPLPNQVGAALIFHADTGALDAVVPERPEDIAADPHRYFGRGLLLDGDTFFVSTGTDTHGGRVIEYRVACGNGDLDACERCDDGNRDAGDGCDAACRLESCGDGAVQAGEECDDGNAVDGDGCDASCTVTGCGNCVVAGTEECDDGNTRTGDACDADCTWPACANGELAPSEGCDDGNTAPGDGCSPVCKAEVCGDGALDAGESCDDGGVANGDGCDEQCRLESAKLDWWHRVYGLYAGDVGGALFSTGQTYLVDGYVFLHSYADTGFSWAALVDRETGEKVHAFPGYGVRRIAPAPAGFLVTDAPDDTPVVRLYDRATFALRRTFEDPVPDQEDDFGWNIAGIASSVLVQEPSEHAVHVFDAGSGAFARTLAEPAPPGNAYDFGAASLPFRGGALVSGTSAAHLFDLATGAVTRTFRAPGGGAIAGTMVVPVAGDVLAPAADGTVYRLDGATGAVAHTFAPPAGYPSQATFPASTTPSVAVLGDEIAIAYTALGAVHLHDAATNALQRVLRNPEPSADSCFGAPLARLDLGIAVSDPCAGNEEFEGIVHLFDHERGQLVATILDPNNDYRDFFGTRGAFDDTLLTKYQNLDDGVVNAWRPTMDGVVAPGEECDDGNLVNGDGCDVSGTVPRCGNGFVTAGETCDDGNRVAGDGCEPDCTPTFTCDPAARIENARLVLRHLGGGPGDETLVLTGRLAGLDPSRSAFAEGAQVLVADAEGRPLVDLTSHAAAIAPGPRGSACGARDGWRVDATREIYANASGALPPACVPGSAHGLTRLVLGDGATGPRSLQLRMRHATLPAFTSPLRVVVAVGADLASRCSGRSFAALECRANRRGTTLVCH